MVKYPQRAAAPAEPPKPPTPSRKPKSYHPPLFGTEYTAIEVSKICPINANAAIQPCHRPVKKPGPSSYTAHPDCLAQPVRTSAATTIKQIEIIFFILCARVFPSPYTSCNVVKLSRYSESMAALNHPKLGCCCVHRAIKHVNQTTCRYVALRLRYA